MEIKQNIPYDELLTALLEAHQQVLDLQGQLSEYKWIEGALRKRTKELSERVKELDCLFSISDMLRNRKLNLEELLQNITDTLITAFQYPESTSALLTVGNRVFRSQGFVESPYAYATNIDVNGRCIGRVTVYITQQNSSVTQVKFLPEEKSLLHSTAIWIGEIVEHRHSYL